MKTRACLILSLIGLCAVLCACEDEGDDDAGADDDQAPADDDDNNDLDDDDNDNNDADDDDDNNDDTDLPDGIYVALTGDNQNPGTPAQPKRTIKSGLTVAAPQGLPVFVAEGEYRETLTVRTSLYGGYRASDWARDIDAYPTIVNADEEVAVTVDNRLDGILYLDGLTIRGENATDVEGGIGVDIVLGPAQVTRSHIESPVGPSGGATGGSIGMRIRGRPTVSIERCVIRASTVEGPSALSSYGIYVVGEPTRVEIRYNTIASGDVVGGTLSAGAFVAALSAEVVLHANQITAGSVDGGLAFSDGVEIQFGYVTLIGNVIRSGPATGGGPSISAGVHTHNYTPFPVIVGNTIASGIADFSQALEFEGGATVVDNALVGANTAMLSAVTTRSVALWNNDLFCVIPGCAPLTVYGGFGFDVDQANACEWPGCAAAGGNIAAYPGFIGDDPHLPAGSPCVDTGVDPSPWTDEPFVVLDIDGNVRPQWFGWDIGADERME